MSDEFVCEECAYSSAVDEKACPLCGGKLVSLDDGIEQDLAYAEAYNDDAEDDEFDFEPDELPRAA